MAGQPNPVTRMEQRMWSAVIAIAMLLGGWWLQNQYDTTLRLQEELGAYMRFVDDRYVEKDHLKTVTDRLTRIEGKLDLLAESAAREKRERQTGK